MRKLAAALFAAAGVALLTPLTPAGADQPPAVQDTTSSWLRLTVDSISPQELGSADTSVTVTATITDISSRQITNLRGQLRLGGAVTSEQDISTALASATTNYGYGSPFVPVTGPLQPGQSARVRITMPVSGSTGLDLSQPGVYPLLVNINGTPDYGGQSRLAAATTLLPVGSLPGGSTPAPTGPAKPLTLLWPLVDTQPRLLPTVNGQTVLTDDALAASLAAGGRLADLLAAAQHASGTPAFDSLCFVIDPDLVDTVSLMQHGYLVRNSAGSTVTGRGAAAAGQWLAQLRTLVNGHCVLPLPYADADPGTLSGSAGLAKLAIGKQADIDGVLKPATPALVSGVLWPASGNLSSAGLSQLAGLDQDTVLLDPATLRPAPVGSSVQLDGSSVRAVSLDGLVSALLAGTAPGLGAGATDKSVLAGQSGLGALVYQAMFAGGTDSLLVAPPRRWNASQAQLDGLVDTVNGLLNGHYASALGLAQRVEANPAGTATPSGAAIPTEVLPAGQASGITEQDANQENLLAAMHADPTNPTNPQPADLLAPLQDGLLRAASIGWQGNPAGASAALAAAQSGFTDLTDQVTVRAQTRVVSLGGSTSPLPVNMVNHLPVDIEVQINLSGESGLQLPSTLIQRLPAGTPEQILVPEKQNRTGRFSVEASLSTPQGDTQLGQSVRLEFASSAYGTIIVVVTGIAFGVLVLLSGRRIYRRIRASRATAGPPIDQEPSDHS